MSRPHNAATRCLGAFCLLALSFVSTAPARAQDLISGLSQDQVEINTGYVGTTIVVFGAIEGTDNEPAGSRGIVIVVRGPQSQMIVRRKERIAGIWINRDQVRLDGMPSFYYLASSQPLDRIAPEPMLARYQLGLDNLTPQRSSASDTARAGPFVVAAVAQRARSGLYGESQDVEFLSYSLFRARIPIPATAPRGEYTVEAYLFRDGTVASAQSTPLFVDQKGLERRLYRFAHAQPLAYGLTAILLAMLLGWISSLLIRPQA